jgi:hypothetical protein
MERFTFKVSPLGTADAAVVETEINSLHVADFKAAVTDKEGVSIENNPAWADVKTDDGTNGDTTPNDGKNDGTRYGWAASGKLYEIV